eukprot:TRINITY_DN565_c0_g1_i2.p1 TRINITY_DN565_c0_g1~~TRINITY_DN565_c0_g1_i2.p1  ORF type:complete len:169 (+),score=36.32 TRINITY_DN565_c0_g1_i2:234-740(+)
MKTGLCSFSGFKIYPGHGIKFIRGDSKVFTFIGQKSEMAFHHKVNPRKCAWTTVYRRLHKKGITEEVKKQRVHKIVKQQRDIVGASLEVIRQKASQKPEVRAAAREAAARELKEKKKAIAAKKAASAPAKEGAAKKGAAPAKGKAEKSKSQAPKSKAPAPKPSASKGR